MIQLDNLRPVHNAQGLGHYDPPHTHTSNTSPLAITHTSRPNLPTGDIQHNGLIHWNHAQTTNYDKQATTYDQQSTEKSDDDEDEDDEYRPFTPPPPRERLSYTRYQLELLSGIYEKVRYPNSTQKQLIAKRVGITREQVKIWFQNRRRKDVINNPKSKDKDDSSNPPTSPPQNETSSKCDSSDKSSSSPTSSEVDGPKMVPNVVLKSVINELERFEKTVLKSKKTKKKSKQKQQKIQQQQQLQQKMAAIAAAAATAATAAATAASTSSVQQVPASSRVKGVSLFNAYDMISPPNKVITPGFLDTTVNRFSHSKSSSAFQDPKSSSDQNTSPTLVQGYQQLPNPISVLPNEYSSHNSTVMTPHLNNQPKGHSVFENIPVLADLLGYRPGDKTPKQPMGHTFSPHHPFTSPRNNSDRCYSDIPGSVNHGSLGVNRVFPFPFIADAPVMLSSVRHPDPYRPPVHYLHHQHTEDPYQPFMISSFSNPYYSTSAAPSQTWPPQQTPSSDNSYTAGAPVL
ncbi:hypothetical protein LOTGIDRAFT_169764 [Lottia gigantea]|uniref:Homeobox domain-containing protein n=1 Tax=Lottia gigantea TaxID=225164 RepID=V4B3K2_LOTGI|nr:hypothetical protein LOTGIDRAFT_169764 [Lottia gigantea]ESO82944.1 hypothetical protein LOTGIDRAFT_169764 [Lottia gigantea]